MREGLLDATQTISAELEGALDQAAREAAALRESADALTADVDRWREQAAAPPSATVRRVRQARRAGAAAG
jgi:hypothetical protein